jgi:hypothetical protein
MQTTKTPIEGLHIDWTLNITTIGAILLMLIGWAVQMASYGSRLTAVEAQNVQQAVANEKLAATVQRLDTTLTRLLTQVEERQRQSDARQDRSDFRQDKAELHNQR